jgi:uncharacterized OB-fold protein
VSGLTLERHREGLARGRIAVAGCSACGCQQAILGDSCFACGAGTLETHDHSGHGRVFSWVVNHFAFAPALEAEVPYCILLVSLDGGGRIYGRLAAPHGQIEAEMPVVLDEGPTRERGYPVFRQA